LLVQIVLNLDENRFADQLWQNFVVGPVIGLDATRANELVEPVESVFSEVKVFSHGTLGDVRRVRAREYPVGPAGQNELEAKPWSLVTVLGRGFIGFNEPRVIPDLEGFRGLGPASGLLQQVANVRHWFLAFGLRFKFEVSGLG